jgi:hypothetical protein
MAAVVSQEKNSLAHLMIAAGLASYFNIEPIGRDDGRDYAT